MQEVITNEHVVAMMKAAISETEDIPLFVSKNPFRVDFSVVPKTRRLPRFLFLLHDVVWRE